MSDKYIDLSIDETVGLLENWRSASTELFLKLSSLVGVSFEGTVRVVKAGGLSVRFKPLDARGKEVDAELGVTLFDSRLRRVGPETPRRWLACVWEPDLRLVLTELTELENLDDFVLASTLEQ
jgi:hypothetical protein